MPLFFFDLYNDEITIDEEGRELPDLKGARQHAIRDARHMAAESVCHGHLNRSHYIEVSGEDRRALFRITFGEAVAIID